MKTVTDFISNNFESIIALCALFLSIYTAKKQQEFNRNSVRPICNIISDCVGEKFFIEIQNAGSGPMIIRKMDYRIKKQKKIKNNLSDYVRDIQYNMISENHFNGRGVAPGDTKTIFTATFKTQGDIFDFGEQISEVTVYVIYEDIYQIQWIKQLNLGKEVERYLEIIKNKNSSTKEFSNTYEPYRKSV